MKAINIQWDTDGQKVALPTEVEIPDNIVDEDEDDETSVANYLTDTYGWCVISLELE
jgi:hypothetical protein